MGILSLSCSFVPLAGANGPDTVIRTANGVVSFVGFSFTVLGTTILPGDDSHGMETDHDETVKQRIRRFDRTHGEALIVSAMVAFFISAAILQFPESVTAFTAMLVLGLWAYTAFVFGFELVVIKVVR